MPDINQVRKALHCCSSSFDLKCECCLYHGIEDCEAKLKRDAEELLGEYQKIVLCADEEKKEEC